MGIGKVTSEDLAGWEGKGIGRLHQEIGWSGKERGWEGYLRTLGGVGREGNRKATSGDWVEWEGKGRERHGLWRLVVLNDNVEQGIVETGGVE
jgi:hypothetical protein